MKISVDRQERFQYTVFVTERHLAATTEVTPQMLLNARRSEDEGSDLWRTFNRVQENATQGFRGRYNWELRRRQRGVRAIKNIDGDVKINRALWSLAEKMATLKKS